MTIEAKVIEDSVFNGSRLTTMQLLYPRFIHAEFMTHRAFSRNASSSRAIPVEKLVNMAMEDPAFFVHIGSNKPGMQAGDEVDAATRHVFETEWKELCGIAAEYARAWAAMGIHKQVVNRVMEPWHHIAVVVTATEWENFFKLRCHPAAQPEMQALATAIRDAMDECEPREVKEGFWHLPYVTHDERQGATPAVLVKLSTARCARVSYMNHDGTSPNQEKDISLHDMLVASDPAHASPAEHQARAVDLRKIAGLDPKWMSNLNPTWVQYRKFIENYALVTGGSANG